MVIYMKHPPFINNGFFHVYNRGVDQRNIFSTSHDVKRFLESMNEFNTEKPIGSIYESSFLDPKVRFNRKKKRLINIIAYCLNPNHFHLILQQVRNGGISEFMKRLLGGYTWYFNNKHKRNGSLFQGTFKAKYIDSNEYLLHLSAYVNLNKQVHQLSGLTAKLSASSWDEYIEKILTSICNKNVILKQFNNVLEYKHFSESLLIDIIDKKQRFKELENLLLEET